MDMPHWKRQLLGIPLPYNTDIDLGDDGEGWDAGEVDFDSNDQPVDTCLGPDESGVGPWTFEFYD